MFLLGNARMTSNCFSTGCGVPSVISCSVSGMGCDPIEFVESDVFLSF